MVGCHLVPMATQYSCPVTPATLRMQQDFAFACNNASPLHAYQGVEHSRPHLPNCHSHGCTQHICPPSMPTMHHTQVQSHISTRTHSPHSIGIACQLHTPSSHVYHIACIQPTRSPHATESRPPAGDPGEVWVPQVPGPPPPTQRRQSNSLSKHITLGLQALHRRPSWQPTPGLTPQRWRSAPWGCVTPGTGAAPTAWRRRHPSSRRGRRPSSS